MAAMIAEDAGSLGGAWARRPFADLTNVVAGGAAPGIDADAMAAGCGGDVCCGGGHTVAVEKPSAPAGDACQSLFLPGHLKARIAAMADNADPQQVTEYTASIFSQMLMREGQGAPQVGAVLAQREINGRMRAILNDWLIEVQQHFRLRRETLFLAVALVDRYLSRVPIRRRRLQLLGVAAMLVASKFEEIHPPETAQLLYISDNAYTAQELLLAETALLRTLDYEVAIPTVVHFLGPLQAANECDAAHRELVWYIASLSLLDVHLLRFPPSILAAAALLLSNEVRGRRQMWPKAVADRCGYCEQELWPCAEELRFLHRAVAADSLKALRQQFSSEKHYGVATAQF